MDKVNQFQKEEKDRKKNENISLIIAERDFFKNEAMRLNKLCKGRLMFVKVRSWSQY